ncbi:MAG: MFS transporter [Chromatiaceae bacterium]|nr:MFS transporter [Chromatiaceae bacterium]MCP5444456.1 MFS transporter [Chromatiaceae bacterium]
MPARNQIIILYCAVVAFGILYEHQPLLPLLANQWGRSLSDAALVTTVTMIPLAVAPLVYGYFLERFSSRYMLIGGFLFLLMTQAVLSTAPDYQWFLTLRAVEGLLLPAIFTSLMTYTSALGGSTHARRNISFYIAATIVGGYLGRTLTGLVTDLASWQIAFWMWAALASIAVFTLWKLDSDPRGQLERISWMEIRRLVHKPVNREGLGAAFLLFFVSASMMNFLPFRMFELNPQISTGQMAQVYTGYLVGAVIAVFSTRIIALIGNERRTLLVAAALYFCGVLLFKSERIALLYFAMFVLMAGMFSIHSVLSGYLNHLEAARKGMINGLYVSCYYSGGVLGSFLPGLLYQSAGWNAYSHLMLVLIATLAFLVWLMPSGVNIPKNRT